MTPAARECNQTTGYHVGSILTDVDDQDVMYDYCPACGYTWMFGKVSPERAAAVRRAVKASKARGR